MAFWLHESCFRCVNNTAMTLFARVKCVKLGPSARMCVCVCVCFYLNSIRKTQFVYLDNYLDNETIISSHHSQLSDCKCSFIS